MPMDKCLGTSFSRGDESQEKQSIHKCQPQPGEEKAALWTGTQQQDTHHVCAQQLEKLRHPQAAIINTLAHI